MPFAATPRAEPVTSHDRRRIAVVGAAIVLVVAAVAIWAAVRPGSYDGSRAGCVTVTMPSSTGGALIHECGPAARLLCKRAFAATDRISLLTRPQCRLAGLAPAGSQHS
jgi:hypothetical protein